MKRPPEAYETYGAGTKENIYVACENIVSKTCFPAREARSKNRRRNES